MGKMNKDGVKSPSVEEAWDEVLEAMSHFDESERCPGDRSNYAHQLTEAIRAYGEASAVVWRDKRAQSCADYHDANKRANKAEASLMWVDKTLDNAVRVVQSWPEWMQRPELRAPGSNGASASDSQSSEENHPSLNQEDNTENNITENDFQKALDSFIEKCQGKINILHADFPLKPPTLKAMHGKKNVKVVSVDGDNGSRYAWCFVEISTGNVLKAASWASPAKHARANIYQPESWDSVTAYGPAHLR